MAGSYKHIVDKDGRLLNPRQLLGMLDASGSGDVFEAVEELYGMVWYLAGKAAGTYGGDSADHAAEVEEARINYRLGLTLSPGRGGRLEEEDE